MGHNVGKTQSRESKIFPVRKKILSGGGFCPHPPLVIPTQWCLKFWGLKFWGHLT